MTAEVSLATARTASSTRSDALLVVHGDKDYRVPIGEAHGCGPRWRAVGRRRHDAAQVPVLPRTRTLGAQPQHTKVWYQVVEAFLDTTVHGKPWQVPDLLR
jgi:hypothetical protein